VIAELTQAVRGRQTVNPRTVLGFLATVLGLVLTASIAGVWILASTSVGTYLIPWLLIFCAILAVLLIGGVFAVTLIDPSRLMLGQVTGTEYAEIQRAVLGDSIRGERSVSGIESKAFGDVGEIAAATVVDPGNVKA
jgi:hypothetical protein